MREVENSEQFNFIPGLLQMYALFPENSLVLCQSFDQNSSVKDFLSVCLKEKR